MSSHPFVRFCMVVGGLLTVALLFALLELTKPAAEIVALEEKELG